VQGTANTASKGRRLWTLGLLFGVQALFLLGIYWLARAYAPPAEILPIESVALPGKETALRVRIERDYPLLRRRGVSGVEVEFEAVPASGSGGGEGAPAATRLGKATTDAGGVAALRLEAPETAAAFRYRARVTSPEAPPLERPEADIVLQVAPAGACLVFASVRGTLRERPLDDVQSSRGGKLTSAAREALAELGKSCAILYLATLSGDAPSRLRPWLEASGFPPGAILFAPGAEGWEELRAFLARQDLGPWKGRAWGICATDAEAEGFQLSGLRAIILDENRAPAPRGHKVFSARNWTEARRIIEKNP
jgi:hypothetical protein